MRSQWLGCALFPSDYNSSSLHQKGTQRTAEPSSACPQRIVEHADALSVSVYIRNRGMASLFAVRLCVQAGLAMDSSGTIMVVGGSERNTGCSSKASARIVGRLSSVVDVGGLSTPGRDRLIDRKDMFMLSARSA